MPVRSRLLAMSDTLAESVSKTEGLDPSQTPFTLWTVVKRIGKATVGNGKLGAFDELTGQLAQRGITLRGAYDVSAMRNDADVMLWLVGPSAEGLQQAIRDIRRTELFANTEITWSAMGVHREAEFAKSHIPTYMRAGIEPKQWVCVYPFVRSYEWYILPDEGSMRWAVSLGVFSTEEAAKTRLETLRARGVRSAQTGERDTQVAKIWFQLRGTDAALQGKLKGFAKALPGTEIRDCQG